MKKRTTALQSGRYIVADPRICHGKPTFRGARIFVADVLEQVAEGLAWETKLLRNGMIAFLMKRLRKQCIWRGKHFSLRYAKTPGNRKLREHFR